MSVAVPSLSLVLAEVTLIALHMHLWWQDSRDGDDEIFCRFQLPLHAAFKLFRNCTQQVRCIGVAFW